VSSLVQVITDTSDIFKKNPAGVSTELSDVLPEVFTVFQVQEQTTAVSPHIKIPLKDPFPCLIINSKCSEKSMLNNP
jgi:hypothetical protein